MVSSEFIADYLISTVGLKLLLLIISVQVGSKSPKIFNQQLVVTYTLI